MYHFIIFLGHLLKGMIMQVYRDDALQMPRPQTAATAYPTAWVLIWRSNGSKPVTMWKPVAPAGYRALGTVIVSRPDQPKLEQALCVRGDLVEPSSSFEAPIWVHRPPELNQVRLFFRPQSSACCPA